MISTILERSDTSCTLPKFFVAAGDSNPIGDTKLVLGWILSLVCLTALISNGKTE
jgi:hypothetical protein